MTPIGQEHKKRNLAKSRRTALFVAALKDLFRCVRKVDANVKSKSNVSAGLARHWGLQKVWAPTFQDNRHKKLVRLSALRTRRSYIPGNIPGTHFCYRLSRSQGQSAAGRIMSTKNSNNIIGNRNRDLPACSAVPQPTALLRDPGKVQRTSITLIKIKNQNYTRSKTFFLMLSLFCMLNLESHSNPFHEITSYED
jgi:hypothetical protein